MSISYQNPFVGLEDLRNKIENRIQLRQEILQNISQGSISVEEGFQQAESAEIELLDDPDLSTAILQGQLNLLNKTVALVDQKQAEIEDAERALASIQEKNTAIDQLLGTDCLQKADVALLDLNIETLGKLLTKFKEIYPPVPTSAETSIQPAYPKEMDTFHSEQQSTIDSTELQPSDQPVANIVSNLPEPREKILHDWYRELQADHEWLNIIAGYESSDWSNLQRCRQNLVQGRTEQFDDQGQFLERLDAQHPNSRLMSSYRLLDINCRKEPLKLAEHNTNVQFYINELIKSFNRKATVEELESKLNLVETQMKDVLEKLITPDVMNILLTSFINNWTKLIYDSKQLQKTIDAEKEFVSNIAAKKNLRLGVKRIRNLIDASNDMILHLYLKDCEDLLGELKHKGANYYENQKYADYIQGLSKKATVKSEQGKERFDRVWTLR